MNWDVNQFALRFASHDSGYTGYTGRLTDAVIHLYGVITGSVEDQNTAQWDARMITTGPAKPTGSWHQQGDFQTNTLGVPGSAAAWSNASIAQAALSANVVSGTTTSVAISPCPAVAPPVGTPIYDIRVAGFLPVLLGLYSNCSNPGGAGTLTFTGAAQNNGTAGDTIKFFAEEPVGLIGSTYPVIVTTGPCVGSSLTGGLLYGGSVSGTFVAPLCSASNFIISSFPTAPNGWNCLATDRTTPADLLTQAVTGNSTTAAKLNATTAASDIIGFTCNPY